MAGLGETDVVSAFHAHVYVQRPISIFALVATLALVAALASPRMFRSLPSDRVRGERHSLADARAQALAHREGDVVRRGRPERGGLVEGEAVRRDYVLIAPPCQHHLVKRHIRQRKKQRTVGVFVCILGNECVKSHQGETSTAPAGGGRSQSRMTWRSAIDNPPPAESPATTMCWGLTGRCAAPSGGRIRYRSRE